MRVLLTGGTGFIGTALRAALEGRGEDVAAVSRKGPISWGEIEAEVARADVIVHLAGEPIAEGRWTKARFERIRSSRVDTTERIARAVAAAARKPLVFVSGSAVGIYGMRTGDEVLDESAPPGDDILARVVVAWEAAAQPARAAGVRVVHPRIGVVFGRGGGALAKLAAPYAFFVGGPLGSGRQWISWVHRTDVVRALLFAIDQPSLSGPLNVVAPHPVTMAALSRAIGRALGRPAVMRVPAFALRLALGRGLAGALLSGQRAAPRRLTEAGFAFEFPEVDQAVRDLLESHLL
jgi:uncharacterized protein (TIGR01777 family)